MFFLSGRFLDDRMISGGTVKHIGGTIDEKRNGATMESSSF